MKSVKNILAATLLVLVIIIVLQNTATVDTRLLFVTLSMPRALLLLLTLLIGVVVGLILGSKFGGSKKDDE